MFLKVRALYIIYNIIMKRENYNRNINVIKTEFIMNANYDCTIIEIINRNRDNCTLQFFFFN